MFQYFPGNRRWSTAVNVALMAGATLGEVNPWIAPLRERTEEVSTWRAAWTDAGLHQEQLAERDDANGFALSASRRSLRAVVYYTISEWYTPPGPDKAECYSATLQAFAKAREYGSLAIERVDAPIAGGGFVPGYLSTASSANSRYRPVVICAGDPNIPKELTYCIVGDAFARAGLDVLVVDFPGSGEALRLGGLEARPDSETAVGALVDHLNERERREIAVGALGVGAGGHQVIRAAALEPRIAACATWGGITDMNGARRDSVIDVPHQTDGSTDVADGVERHREWSLDDILPSLAQPLLVLHGASDGSVPIDEVLHLVDAAPSFDKTLWLFEDGDGGAERFQADQPDAARDMLGGWFADRLARAVAERAHAPILR